MRDIQSAILRGSPDALALPSPRLLVILAFFPLVLGLWRSIEEPRLDPLLMASLIFLVLLRAGRKARPSA